MSIYTGIINIYYCRMIINAPILLGENFELLEEGHIVIEEGIIRDVKDGFIPGGIDARNYLIMPSLINAHTHLGDSFAKEAVLGLSVKNATGRKGLKWRLYEETENGEIVRCMHETLRYMLNSGTAAFADFREFGVKGIEQLKNAINGIPIKAIILSRDTDMEGCDGLGLNTYQLDQIPGDRQGKLIAIHAGECKREIENALRYKPDILIHLTLATPEEMKVVAKRKISVVICPRSNAVLGVGILNVMEMLNSGINISLGTDNVMINSPNLFREMEFVSKLSYLHDGIPPTEILKMATVNASKAFHLNSGSVDKGRHADLLFIDKNAPNIRDNKDLIPTIIHRCEPENVRKIMVNGRFVVDKD